MKAMLLPSESRSGAVRAACLALVLLLLQAAAQAGDFKFRKMAVSPLYDSEGATSGDINGDGKPDLVSGPYWYEGPAFTARHSYQTVKTLDPAVAYSGNFMGWVDDFNGDALPDILMAGLPGDPAYWYQNPGPGEVSKPALNWTRRVAFPALGNESPEYLDVNGDGKREVAFNTDDGYIGWAAPDPANIEAVWKMRRITPKGDQNRFTHGLGFGDVNGDGRLDLLEKDGWWEQPGPQIGDPIWKKHPVSFGNGGAQMHAYDVDGDGDNDVLTSLEAHGFGLAWFEQVKQGDTLKFTKHMIMGTRQEEAQYGAAFSQLHSLALTDIDGDGLKDLVTGKRKWAHGPTGDVEPNATFVLYAFQLQRVGGKAVYTPRLIDTASGSGTQLEVRDMDGDGQKDLLIGNKNGTFIFFKDGSSNPILPFRRKRMGESGLPREGEKAYDALGAERKWGTGVWENRSNPTHFTLARPGGLK
jgi:hypothetical protein